MAIKYQLQYSLFNGTYYFNGSNGDKGIKNLTSVLEYLETIADTLQDIKVCMHKLHGYMSAFKITILFAEKHHQQTMYSI